MVKSFANLLRHPPKSITDELSPEQDFRGRVNPTPPLLFANITLHEHTAFLLHFHWKWTSLSAPWGSMRVESRDKKKNLLSPCYLKSVIFDHNYDQKVNNMNPWHYRVYCVVRKKIEDVQVSSCLFLKSLRFQFPCGQSWTKHTVHNKIWKKGPIPVIFLILCFYSWCDLLLLMSIAYYL